MGTVPTWKFSLSYAPGEFLFHHVLSLKFVFANKYVKLSFFKIYNVNSFPGQPSTTHRQPHCADTELSPAQNGLHPSTHSISVLSSVSPATGYFGEQEEQESSQNSVIPQQVNSLHGAESLSSKQH